MHHEPAASLAEYCIPIGGTAGISRAVGLGFVMLRVRLWLQEIQAKHDL
jgi:hypothetical protein